MAIGTQMTASALSLVTPISVNWSIVITVFICCIYTTSVKNHSMIIYLNNILMNVVAKKV